MHISIEGFDGVGKTTVSTLVAAELDWVFVDKPLKHIFDPDGGITEYLRIRDYFNEISPRNKALSACFYGLGNMFLYEKFKDCNIVTDRHILSNYAWSGGTESMRIFEAIHSVIGSPTLTVILYADNDTITKRLRTRDTQDLDLKKLKHSEEIYSKMKFFAEKYKMPYIIIDTNTLSPNDVVSLIMAELKKRNIIDEHA